MARPITELFLEADMRKELQSMIDRPKAAQRDVRQARIILKRAEGLSQQQTAEAVGVNRPVVVKWEQRFRQAFLWRPFQDKGDAQRNHYGGDATTGGAHTLVVAEHGQGQGGIAQHGAAAVAGQ